HRAGSDRPGRTDWRIGAGRGESKTSEIGEWDEPPLDFIAATRRRVLASSPCRSARWQLRARAGEGGLLRPRDPYVPPPSPDGLDELGRPLAASRLRPQQARRQPGLALGRTAGAGQCP